MRYFSYISHHFTTKNRLEKAIAEFLVTKNRQVITSKEADLFKENIIKGIESLNKQHTRCKPFIPTWYSFKSFNDDILLSGVSSICNFHLYTEKI